MPRLLPAALAALALMMPPAPSAAADGQDLAKILAGLVALYVAKEAIENRRDDGAAATATHAPSTRAQVHPPAVAHAPDRRRDDLRGLRLIPLSCLRTYETRHGIQRGFGRHCMVNSVARPSTLPAACVRQVRTKVGPRAFYGRDCLRDHGWRSRLARRY
jgi:hypothetical protein